MWSTRGQVIAGLGRYSGSPSLMKEVPRSPSGIAREGVPSREVGVAATSCVP